MDNKTEAVRQLTKLKFRFYGQLDQRLANLQRCMINISDAAIDDLDCGQMYDAISELLMVAHSFSGTAGMFGLIELGQSATTIEGLCRELNAERKVPSPLALCQLEQLVFQCHRQAQGIDIGRANAS